MSGAHSFGRTVGQAMIYADGVLSIPEAARVALAEQLAAFDDAERALAVETVLALAVDAAASANGNALLHHLCEIVVRALGNSAAVDALFERTGAQGNAAVAIGLARTLTAPRAEPDIAPVTAKPRRGLAR